VGVLAVGVGVYSGVALPSCVTNASLKVGVGVAVFEMTSNTNGSGVWVTVAGTGDEVGRIPPRGVGVVYCPHSEAFPPQDASKKDAAIKTLISRFTKKIRRWELYLYKPDNRFTTYLNKDEVISAYFHLEI